MARFEREAQTLAALNHPNIATVYGIEQGALVMELVAGAISTVRYEGRDLSNTFERRVISCFQSLAAGDAIGKQTETLSRAEVRRWYPGGIAGFHGRPGDVIPRYAGKRYEWRVGETTDDTEQTLAVTRALLREGRASHTAIGRELLQCRKSLHPGVSLWSFVQAGDPAHIAFDGDGCGAAMRSAPIGVVYRTSRLDELVRAAYQCAIPTHGGQLAISAAAAVAGAVSAALEGRPVDEVAAVACQAGGAAIARSIEEMKCASMDELAERYFPDRPQNIVPLAIALALRTQSAQETALLAANIGGDADSVASIGSAIAGALAPETVNQDWVAVVSAVNGDDLVEAVTALIAA
jgi:ADP-ribosylglycohydrolase